MQLTIGNTWIEQALNKISGGKNKVDISPLEHGGQAFKVEGSQLRIIWQGMRLELWANDF